MSEKRKSDHINLAFDSVPTSKIDLRGAFYEPLLSAHNDCPSTLEFLGSNFKLPLWVSSMTGGTEKAKMINKNLAKACGEFGFGMGLGSCRPLLNSNERFSDFDVKEFMPDSPLYTNFGIAQLEDLIDTGSLDKVFDITKSLSADGMIIHINPLQEWAQPEGDRYRKSPIDTIKYVLDRGRCPIIVKEVGQGFGPKSLKLLTDLPLAAIELAGFGGTNFTILEHARQRGELAGKSSSKEALGLVGHSCDEMIGWLNTFVTAESKCRNIIISGGIKNPLDGHLLRQAYSAGPAVFGMASAFLAHSMGSYEELREYVLGVQDIIAIAESYISKS